MAWFYFLPASQEHTYAVETDNHNLAADTFYLETDTIINIKLSIVSTDKHASEEYFRVYPNPASDKLNIEIAHFQVHQS